jgi:hypothetical protein
MFLIEIFGMPLQLHIRMDWQMVHASLSKRGTSRI